MVYLGGKATVWGPVLGAFILVPAQQYLAYRLGASELYLVGYSAVFLAVMLLLPRGILPSLQRPGAPLPRATAGRRRPRRERAARGGGPAQALRRRPGRRRLLVRGRARHGHRADRAERLRQDDRLQPRHGLPACGRRQRHVRRPDRPAARPGSARPPGADPHVPAGARLPAADRAREPGRWRRRSTGGSRRAGASRQPSAPEAKSCSPTSISAGTRRCRPQSSRSGSASCSSSRPR